MKILLSSILLAFFYVTFLFTPPPFMLPAMVLDKLTKEDKKNYHEADEFFQEEKFRKALPLYVELAEKYPDDLYFKYRSGICYLYKDDEREKAIPLLEAVEAGAPDFLEAKFYLGRAYHYQLRFQEAIDKMKEFSRKEGIEAVDQEIINRYIEYCENGKELIKNKSDWNIKNMGPIINTSGSEYVPLLSPDEDVLYFTYKGPESLGGLRDEKGNVNFKHGDYYEDVFIAHKQGNEWINPTNITSEINGHWHEAALAISIDGQRLFVYMSNQKSEEDIYLSKKDGGTWNKPKKLAGDVNTKYWEGSACLASDGRTLYFSSEREGGYGGRDIYTALLYPDGKWRNVTNLGPKINTERDEDSPFIHADGKTLYFSSDGHNSMGSNDIFVSINEEYGWTTPENMGYPISTPSDDRYFIVSVDGKRGYFSSEQKGGYGLQDIYMAFNEEVENPAHLAYFNATVLLDNRPTTAHITVKQDGQDYGYYESNFVTGKTRIVLNEGSNYQIIGKIPDRDDVDPIVEDLDIVNINDIVRIPHTFHFFSKEYTELTDDNNENYVSIGEAFLQAVEQHYAVAIGDEEDLEDDEKVIQEPVENTVVTADTGPCGGPKHLDLSYFVGKDLNDTTYYNQFVATMGNYCLDKLVFKVQIGAYKYPLNFKYPHLRAFGEANILDYPDEITRFTMGTFQTLKKAENLRQRIIKAGQFDAWITPFYKNERYLMQELIAEDFYGKAIN